MANPLPHEAVAYRWEHWGHRDDFEPTTLAELAGFECKIVTEGEPIPLHVRLANGQLVIVRPRPQHEELGNG